MQEEHIIPNNEVEMQGISGIEVARTIRTDRDYEGKFIFISNYPEYMKESFEVQPFHYLQKPLTYAAFCKLMQRIMMRYHDT